jgi:type II secretion system protein H
MTRRPGRWRGFTLIELLVVVAIVGILTTTVALTLPDTPQRSTTNEARRLAALLETALTESLTGRRLLAFSAHADGDGYDFFYADDPMERPPRWLPLTDDAQLRARPLAADVRIATIELDGQPLPPGGLLIFRRGDPPLFRMALRTNKDAHLQPITLRSLANGKVLIDSEP